MEIDTPEIHVLELDGFLNSLRCVIGHPSKVFGAGYIPKRGLSIDSIVEKVIEESGYLVTKKTVDFKYIQTILHKNIYSKLPIKDEETLINLDWNLIEYYGLISTAENEDGKWNRLVSQEHIILESNGNNDLDSFMFFVEYDDFIVETWL
jgi:hypothetical protein